MELTNAAPESVAADWLIVPAPSVGEGDTAGDVDGAFGDLVGRLRERGDVTGSVGETTVVLDPSGVEASRLLIAGCGPADSLDRAAIRKCVLTALRRVCEKPADRVAVVIPEADRQVWIDEVTQAVALAGTGPGLYQKEPKRHELENLILVGPTDKVAAGRGWVLGESMNVTRDLVNRTAADVYPESFAERAAEEAKAVGLECEVFDENWLAENNFGSMLAVARGSDKPARLVVLRHHGAPDSDEWTGLCGKGVTFDSGGLSLKPSASMVSMKADMGGGATVMGAMLAVARLNLPVNVIGVIGLVENMISGNSYRLGDVLTTRSGITVEVHNTDAEGRLVLCDVLDWTAEQGVRRIVDLATLTGACVVALGEEFTGAFPNQQATDAGWADALMNAAKEAAEPIWPMPMDDSFKEQLKSDVADCKNIGTRWGGAITAAKFLEQFVGETPWVHLDIAGPAFAESAKPHRDAGGTGAMVPTLVRLLESA